MYATQSKTILEIDAANYLDQTNISWSIDTGQQNITSNNLTTLNNSETIIVVVETNYTSSAVYPSIARVNSSSYNDTATGVVVH